MQQIDLKAIWLGLALVVGGQAQADVAADENAQIEEVVVQGLSSLQQRLGESGSISVIDAATVQAVGATHPSEVLNRVPGVWINRGSGQEHLTAIRSAVYTGAGACGEFALLEDGIPLRPQGFCNINNLFELNTEQAQAIEVWRGPASAVLGGNALHGAINVISPVPQQNQIGVELGRYDYARFTASGGFSTQAHTFGASFVGTTTNGYRADTGYGQQKLSLSHLTEQSGWSVKNQFTATLLNQETGAYVRGFEAYEDASLRRTNPNPEAFRDAWSMRASSEWVQGQWTLKPYLRRSQMTFLQHFLPGQPLEENEQTSGGLMVSRSSEVGALTANLGGHLEWMNGGLTEFQEGPTTGSAFLVATRPSGLHYDYDVDSQLVAGFYDLQYRLNANLRVLHSLRLEHLRYDYTNNHINGNTQDDGTPCGFGGCLYTRPASRDDSFTNVGVRLGIERDLEAGLLYANVSRGFRPPQVTELYRLRGGQTVADLDSEALTAFEAGFKNQNVALAVFAQRTRNFLFRDSEAYNVSDGRTRSFGAELSVQHQIDRHEFQLAATYARHQYDFDRSAEGREEIADGNDLDSAPRWIGHASWKMALTEMLDHELEVQRVGSYFLNAANTAKYDGHYAVNWRLQWQASERTQVSLRIINLLNERYADRADFAFGGYRYFPAMPRQVYLGARMTLD
jgi:iron complex outermembrane receptor protein